MNIIIIMEIRTPQNNSGATWHNINKKWAMSGDSQYMDKIQEAQHPPPIPSLQSGGAEAPLLPISSPLIHIQYAYTCTQCDLRTYTSLVQACAPRWRLVFTSRADGRSTRGMCYSSGRNLQNFIPRMVCSKLFFYRSIHVLFMAFVATIVVVIIYQLQLFNFAVCRVSKNFF